MHFCFAFIVVFWLVIPAGNLLLPLRLLLIGFALAFVFLVVIPSGAERMTTRKARTTAKARQL